jgi:hypothetical protein
MSSAPIPTLDNRVKTSAYPTEILRLIDYNALVKEVNDVVGFVSRNYSDFEATLDVVQDVEIPNWKEMVLTIYLRASVNEILELWNRLYENVEVKDIVISIQPAPGHD